MQATLLVSLFNMQVVHEWKTAAIAALRETVLLVYKTIFNKRKKL